jgi:hypothetical protein
MSLFNWFSGKSDESKKVATDIGRPQPQGKTGSEADQQLQAAGAGTAPETQPGDRRVKRHARREQLYVAIRESMIRAGVLSSSYKFKVLSLDHRGDQFLVMMDVAPGLGDQADKLTEIETLMINTAKSLFSIYVTAVYWRTDNRPAAASAVNFGASQLADRDVHPQAQHSAASAAKKPGAQRYDPIHDDEMLAFKQALAVASANKPATPDGTGKSRSGLRSFTLITGFEDTELSESSASPALSTTQYGELR